MLHLLSGDVSFETKPGPSGLNYPRIHAQVVEHLIKTCQRHQTILLFGWLRQEIFSPAGPEAAGTSSQADEVEEVEDYDRLDESDSDDDIPGTSPSPTPSTALSPTPSTGPSRGTSFESASSLNQPRPDLPHALPTTVSTSASSQLSYASLPGIQSSSTSSHGAPSHIHTYQPQHQFTPPVVRLPGALSDVFLPGATNSGYVVAAPGSTSSYSHGMNVFRPGAPAPVPEGGILAQPAISVGPVPAVGIPIASTHSASDALTPTAWQGSALHAPPLAPTHVARAVNHININHPLPPSTSSRVLHPHASPSALPVAETTDIAQMDELSEAASYLDVNPTKRKVGRKPKKPALAPIRQSSRIRHE